MWTEEGGGDGGLSEVSDGTKDADIEGQIPFHLSRMTYWSHKILQFHMCFVHEYPCVRVCLCWTN